MRHYSVRTEEAYVSWIKRFILFHGKRHPGEMAAPEVEAFLTDLAVTRKVSASTQNQALSVLFFLYRDVLRLEIGPGERPLAVFARRCAVLAAHRVGHLFQRDDRAEVARLKLRVLVGVLISRRAG